jgi:hypothetical protein
LSYEADKHQKKTWITLKLHKRLDQSKGLSPLLK